MMAFMLRLSTIGPEIAVRRKALNLSQDYLASKADISRATLDALEEGRSNELGFSRLSRILWVLGLKLELHDAGTPHPDEPLPAEPQLATPPPPPGSLLQSLGMKPVGPNRRSRRKQNRAAKSK